MEESPDLFFRHWRGKGLTEDIWVLHLYSVAYPGRCIACACTPGGLTRAPKRRGEKERNKERERKKGKKRGAKEGEKGRERKYAKEKEKREEIKRK